MPRSEQHVSALNVGHDIGMAKRGHNLSEFRHRDLLATKVVNPAQQRNVSRHASIMSMRKMHPPVTCAFVTERAGIEPTLSTWECADERSEADADDEAGGGHCWRKP